MPRIYKLVVAVLFLVLTACAGGSPRYVPVVDRSDSIPVESGETEVAGESVPARAGGYSLPAQELPADSQPEASPAIVALLDVADREIQSGRSDYAVASIERALNLEPKNAMLWSRLAAIRLQQRDWQQAYVLANKSNSLAPGNRSLQRQNWQIIEQAKAGQGDVAGVTEARRMLESLR